MSLPRLVGIFGVLSILLALYVQAEAQNSRRPAEPLAVSAFGAEDIYRGHGIVLEDGAKLGWSVR